jgi:hypothetical protein
MRMPFVAIVVNSVNTKWFFFIPLEKSMYQSPRQPQYINLGGLAIGSLNVGFFKFENV